MSLREYGGQMPWGAIVQGTAIILPKQPTLSRLSSLFFSYQATGSVATIQPVLFDVTWRDGAKNIFSRSTHQTSDFNNTFGVINGTVSWNIDVVPRNSKFSISAGDIQNSEQTLPEQVIVHPGDQVEIKLQRNEAGWLLTCAAGIAYRFRTFD